MPETKYPRGNELLRAVVNKILECPEQWDQGDYHCGSTHCVGGWAQILGGRRENGSTAWNDAIELLKISEVDLDWLFYSKRTLHEIYRYAKVRLTDKWNSEDDYYLDSDGMKLKPL